MRCTSSDKSPECWRSTNPTEVHNGWQRKAWKRWPEADWIQGWGPIALVSSCSGLMVSLWRDRDEAEAYKQYLDKEGCGDQCEEQHSIETLLATHPLGTASLKKKQRRGLCCVPFCRREADCSVECEQSFLGIGPRVEAFRDCPLICRWHARNYELLDREGRMLSETFNLLQVEDGGVK